MAKYALFYKNKEAQICPKIKSKLRTIEARLQMQILLQGFIEKVHKSQHIASLHAAFHCRMQVFRILPLETLRARPH